ncbi:flagellar biosynthetic protein FliR [Aestuariibius sp. 2305UL40-4]|uniref:flagellar biosynthetic protein FliR n=1 Tax=Aestuariibius violaceus TaxID=3234132 RepID=UPI00345E35F3
MIADLTPLIEDIRAMIVAGFAVFLRIGAMMAMLPVFGERSVPVRVRLVLTLAFTLVVAPAVVSQPPPLVAGAAAALGAEVVIGLFWGILIRLFVHALAMAGAIAAQSTSLSQIFGGSAGMEPQPAISSVMVVAGLALAAIMDLHVALATTMISTYDLMPAGQLPDPRTVSLVGVAHVAESFALAFSLAAPFLIVSTLYNVALGVINRAMPQLMVTFVGAPAITAGGLFLLFLTLPFGLALWSDALMRFLSEPGAMPR